MSNIKQTRSFSYSTITALFLKMGSALLHFFSTQGKELLLSSSRPEDSPSKTMRNCKRISVFRSIKNVNVSILGELYNWIWIHYITFIYQKYLKNNRPFAKGILPIYETPIERIRVFSPFYSKQYKIKVCNGPASILTVSLVYFQQKWVFNMSLLRVTS